MSVPAGAVAVLRNAEEALRKLIHEALAQGRYQDVSGLAALADALAHLHNSTDGNGEASTSAQRQQGNSSVAEERQGRRLAARAFPRFERDGDKLVKIAWSKRNRAEYEHRAPRAIVEILIEKIRKKKGEGAKFEAPEILPLKDKAAKDVPSYQAYLALAWLRQEGLVVKYGRDHYAMKPGVATRERIADLWEALPQK
jgi:hypothetical protein